MLKHASCQRASKHMHTKGRYRGSQALDFGRYLSYMYSYLSPCFPHHKIITTGTRVFIPLISALRGFR